MPEPHFVVIGLGSIGRRHAANLAALRPDARFTFVRHAPADDDVSGTFDARVVRSVEAIDEPVDLAVVSIPSARHIETLPTLIERNWPLLVEKPIVSTIDHCDEVEALLDNSAPAIRAAGFNLRHLPSLRKMKRSVSTDLGQVVRAALVAGQWLPDWRPGTDYRTGYSASAARGGGVELDLSHEFDIARWLFGEVQVDAARGRRLSGLELDSNDTAVALLSNPDGRGPLITVTLDYVSRVPRRSYDVVGVEGSLSWDLAGSLDRTGVDGRRSLTDHPPDFDMASSYVIMMQAMLDAIETNDARRVQSLSDGLASSRLAITARNLGSRP